MMRGIDPQGRRVIVSVGFVEVVRMLGIFMIIPVLEVYSANLTRSVFLIAAAFGAYGLASAIFQIPLGHLSDRIGRKPALIIGMVPFVTGNLLTFAIPGITSIIVGRFLAGAGAVGSVATAMVQESVPGERRNAAMALVGIPVGISFLAGLLIGPAIGYSMGFRYLFLISGLLGIAAMGVVTPIRTMRQHILPSSTGKIIFNRGAKWLSISGFAVSFLMITFFYYFQVFVTQVLLERNYVLSLFVPGLIGGVIAVIVAGRPTTTRTFRLAALSLVIILLSVPILFLTPLDSKSSLMMEAGSLLFFLGYSLYEIVFPTAVTRLSRSDRYGSSLGLFNTMQHGGQFMGGIVAGSILGITLTRLSQFMGLIILAALMIVALFAFLQVYRVEDFRERHDR